MLTGQTYKDAVHGYWAKRFGCQPEDFSHPCTWVRAEDDFRDSGTCVLYHMGQASIIRIDPALADLINLPGGMHPQPVAMTEKELQDHIGEQYTVSIKYTLLDHFLDPKDFHAFPAPGGLYPPLSGRGNEDENAICWASMTSAAPKTSTRPTSTSTNPTLSSSASSTARKWPHIPATVTGKTLLPTSAYWCTRTTVSAAWGKPSSLSCARYCFDHDIVPMYRAMDYNTGSLRIPHALGFKLLLIIEVVENRIAPFDIPHRDI